MTNKYESAFGPVVDEQSDSEREPKNYEILDGNEAESLNDSMREYETPFGTKIFAAADKGKNYKNRNEDRVMVMPEKEFVAVVDGMGGYNNGDRAAELLAQGLAEGDGFYKGAELGIHKMQDAMINDAGACFIAAVLEREDGKIYLGVGQSGDCKCIAYNAEGKVIFESKDDSKVNDLLQEGKITADEATYHPERHIVRGGIKPFDHVDYKSSGEVVVNKGDKVLLMSDGISDNLTPEEIGEIIRGKTGSEIVKLLSDITDTRMQNYEDIIGSSNRKTDGKYSDGFKSMPKPDNRSLVVMEIN